MTYMMPMKFAAYTITNSLYAIALPVSLGGERGRWFRHVRNYEILEYGEAVLYLCLFLAILLVVGMTVLGRRSLMGRESL